MADVPVALATAGDRPFKPSVWGNFFVSYALPTSPLGSKEQMRERVNHLKGEVRQMFEVSKASAIEAVKLVGTVQRLGVEHYFREDIDAALSRIHVEELVFGSCNDLHIVALRFRLLRQHGILVPADVFDKFQDDGTGSFSVNLCSSPSALLSLYNAAHMATPEETALDEAIAFTRRHLEAMKSELRSPLAEQVSRALDIPLPRVPKRLETMHYITEYGKEEAHDDVLLELARLDFELVRSLPLKELKTLSLWWRDLYDDVKLSYARDRLIENYFWTCGILHEEEYSRARMLFSKTMGLFSLMDDTYDVHATLEECHKLTEAIERWDESAISILPEYLRKFYLKLLTQFKEFKNSLKPNEKYRMSYIIEATMSLAKYYLQEAKWSNENFVPGSIEHLEVSIMSSGFQPLTMVALMGMGDVATKRVFDWAIGYPDEMKAGAAISRFLNDIASYKNRGPKQARIFLLSCEERKKKEEKARSRRPGEPRGAERGWEARPLVGRRVADEEAVVGAEEEEAVAGAVDAELAAGVVGEADGREAELAGAEVEGLDASMGFVCYCKYGVCMIFW